MTTDTQKLLSDLNRAKVLFQARTLAEVLGMPKPERLDEIKRLSGGVRDAIAPGSETL